MTGGMLVKIRLRILLYLVRWFMHRFGIYASGWHNEDGEGFEKEVMDLIKAEKIARMLKKHMN